MFSSIVKWSLSFSSWAYGVWKSVHHSLLSSYHRIANLLNCRTIFHRAGLALFFFSFFFLPRKGHKVKRTHTCWEFILYLAQCLVLIIQRRKLGLVFEQHLFDSRHLAKCFINIINFSLSGSLEMLADSNCSPGFLILGFHTLHTILGVHCLPLHNLLHYIDNGVLLLTETAVMRLMKGKRLLVCQGASSTLSTIRAGFEGVWTGSHRMLPHSEGPHS